MPDRARRPPRSLTGPPVPKLHPRAPENEIMRLQRQVGNRAVAAYVQTLAVQRVKEGDPPSQAIGVIQQQLNAVGAAPKLAITGQFDAATTAATKAFQRKLIAEKQPGVTEDGIVDGLTHAQLKLRAPSVTISANDTVVIGPGNTQVPDDPSPGASHKELKKGSKGTGVKELQERLNNSGAAPATKLKVDGDFGPLTTAALKAFQTSVPMTASGIADTSTWAKLEVAGAASQGHVEIDWTEEVEGVKNVGGKASFDWKLAKTALDLTVGITFVKVHGGVESAITKWLADIKEIWSTFKAVNVSDPAVDKVDLNFDVKRGGKDHRVKVLRFDPKLAKKKRAESRSDAGTWYTIDTRRSMPAHEYGHLIGLADEYNRTEEHYRDVTGEEPSVGDPTGTVADATKIAGDVKAKLPLDDTLKGKIKAKNDERWGANLAGVVKGALADKQGGFSRLVAQQYAKANAGASAYADIQKAFADKNVPGFQENLSTSVTPFLYSNNSLMGSMLTTPATGGGGAAALDHEHPIEPRHVAPFVALLAKEWKLQTGKADTWKPERR